jgi:hypothetical protein
MTNVETSLESLGFLNTPFSDSPFNLGSLVSTQVGGEMSAGVSIGVVLFFVLFVFVGGLLLGLERKKLKDNCDENKQILDPLEGKKLKTDDGVEVKIESSECENKAMYISGITLMVFGLVALCGFGTMLAVQNRSRAA